MTKIVAVISIARKMISGRVCVPAEKTRPRLLGIAETMPEKMINESPWFLIPNSEISLPSQMANSVPAVIEMIRVAEDRFSPISKVTMLWPANC